MQYEATSVILLAEARHHELQIEAARHGLTRQPCGASLDIRRLLTTARQRIRLAARSGGHTPLLSVDADLRCRAVRLG